MYLLCGTDSSNKELSLMINLHNIKSFSFSIMDIKIDILHLNWVKQNIKNYDIIIFNSPTSINLCKDLLKEVSIDKLFFTVGESSAFRLSKIVSNKIVYPSLNSGEIALIEEKVKNYDFDNKKILIIKGVDGSNNLINYLKLNYIDYKSVDVYERIRKKFSEGYFKNLIISLPLQGIIITSLTLVKWLIELAQSDQCLTILKNLNFITIHQNIAEKLYSYGFNKVYLTKKTNKSAIIELVRDLNE